MARGAASKVEEDDARAVEWVAGRTGAAGGGGGGGRGSREKDIKVRNSQRGERAPPRHRLDRGSLIPLLECSPPSPLPPPPPSATHSPAIHPLSPDAGVPTTTHPPPTPSNWRAPEYVLYIHTRALMSVPVLLPALPLPPPPRRRKRKRERKTESERERDAAPKSESGGSAEKKRQRGYGEGWPKPPLYLSRGTYTRASGTPTSNVVININGAAQYSPDLASPCVYLRSISLLGRAGPFLPPPPRACRTLACGELTLLRFPGPPLTLRRVT